MNKKAWKALQDRKAQSTIVSGGREGASRAGVTVGGVAVRRLSDLDFDFWLNYVHHILRDLPTLHNVLITGRQGEVLFDINQIIEDYIEGVEPDSTLDQMELDF